MAGPLKFRTARASARKCRQTATELSLKGLSITLSAVTAGVLAAAPATAAPGQNCAPPGEERVTESWARTMLQGRETAPIENGAGTVVAVLSTGVDGDQPLLGGRVVAGADVAGGTGVPGNGGAETDCTGIGTQVAGVINARPVGEIAGIAPGARVLPIRVMPDDPAGSEPTPASLARGIRAAAQNGADVVVVTRPVYADQNALRTAVTDAVAAGVVVVAAVGEVERDEEGQRTPYPAAYPGVIGVGAVGPDGAILPSSRRGRFVGLVAPGVAVPSAQTGRGLVLTGGTAIAAGFVGGSAALVRARYPRATPAEVRRLLLVTASPAPADAAYGTGVVSPYAALTYRLVDAEPRGLPGAQAAAPAMDAAELRRRVIAMNAAAAAGILVVVLLLVAAAVRRSSRRRWRPGLPAPAHTPPEPLEPGPPVMLWR